MVDDLDLRIVKSLITDGRQSSRQLGKKLGVSSSTVRRRVDKLLKEDAIRIIALPNPYSIGYGVLAIILLTVNLGWAQRVVEALIQHPSCYTVSECLGRFDVFVGVRFRSLEELSNFVSRDLPKIEGITRSETIVLSMPRKYYDFTWPVEKSETESSPSR